MMLNTTGVFKVGDRVTGEFGTGKILHIHSKKATVEYSYGLKLQIKLCHLQHLEVGTSHFDQQEQFVEGEKCPSFSLTYAAELEPGLPPQDLSQEDSNLSASQKSTSTVATSLINGSQESPTTATCEVSTLIADISNPTSSQLPQIASPSQFKENDWDLPTNETVSQQSPRQSPDSNPNFGASRMLLDCSPVPNNQDKPLGRIFEESSIKFMKAGTMQNGFVYPQDTLPPPSLESGYCWLDSPGALSSSTSRSPGQSKLEASLKSKGLLQVGSVLNPVILCEWYGLPPTYLDPLELRTAAQLLEDSVRQREIFSIPALPVWPSDGYCTCPSCQQPLVNLDDGCGVCGWLYVDTDKNPSKDLEQSYISPSNESPSKKRRQKGNGNGCIYWRTLTKNGKDYPQAYYHWKENGQKKTKYIPKSLLLIVQEAEAAKRPVIEILGLLEEGKRSHNLLGDIEVNPSNSEVLGDIEISPSKNVNIDPSNDISPSKMRRHKGEGSGSIHWRILTKNGKDYPQAYYHYEFWSEGDRLIKSTKYIPKQLLRRIQELEANKAPVREILKVLGVKI